ncbi:MAG: sigma 54-interacting transcriptional regulator [bacterium]
MASSLKMQNPQQTHYPSDQIIDLAYALNQQNDFLEMTRLVAQKCISLLNAELALILMINPRTRDTVKTIMREGHYVESSKYRPVQNQVSGWIMKNNAPLLSEDIQADARFAKVRFDGLDIGSIVGVPLRIEGFIVGALIAIRKPGSDTFRENDVIILEKIGVIAAPYLRNGQNLREYFKKPLPDEMLLPRYAENGLLGRSPKFIELLRSLESAARCDVRVLLEGESGTGKELVAQAIHTHSARNGKPFVAVDCGAIAPNLIESELFGHVKGAFTSAVNDRKGLFEEADGGTLFMDEITNLPLEMQAKLLRVLQEGDIRPLGSNQTRKVDVRIISASSMSLRERVESNLFREDLYYRLHVYPIRIPSLNERQEDIAELAFRLLKKFTAEQNKKVNTFHEEIIDFMKNRHWPGNIRELENFIERLVTTAPSDVKKISRKQLSPDQLKEMKQNQKIYDESYLSKSLSENVAELEAQLIRRALHASGGNQSKAARLLKIPVQTLRYKIEKLGISV